MQPPPPFPFWPLSPSGPKQLSGERFKDEELQSLDAFKRALAARGLDYKSIQVNDPATLLLDLNNASEQRLLRRVVNDWGMIYCLWKASDAYIESRGERRQQLRHLLKYLFFWGSDYPGRSFWPLKLLAGLSLFRREKGMASVRRRLVRAESLARRLSSSLAKITRELRICSVEAKSSLRQRLVTEARECEAVLKEAEYFGTRARQSRRSQKDDELEKEETLRAGEVILRMVKTMERALACLEHAVYRLGPIDAHRARHVMRQSEAVLRGVVPNTEPETSYASAAVMLFDAFLYLSRILVGFWLIPLVLASRGHLQPKTDIQASS